MSVEPPSSGRPTGPPSGPLGGPSQPPSGPPSPPPGGTSGGTPPGGTPEPRRQWWKSTPRVALFTTALVVAVALVLVLTRTDGGGRPGGRSEVFLQAASKPGPDPFTDSTATTGSAPPTSSAPATTTSESANVVRGVDGGAGGLYGGTQNAAACDVEKQIRFLLEEPAKNRAFASVAGVDSSQVPAYLRSLTPVQLRMDTRVTNHGYRDGAATGYQAVLQAGTAVLIDARGVPRVRCACGNPLTPPVAQPTTPKLTGDSWPSYRPSNVVVVTPSTTVVNVFVLYDPGDKRWFARHRGDTECEKDRPAKPPANPPAPTASVSLSPSPSSPAAPTSPKSPGSPTSSSPSPPSPRPESPSPEPESPSPESPSPAPESPSPGSPSPEPESPSPEPESPSPEPESPTPPGLTSAPATEAPSPPEASPPADTYT